MKGPIINCRYLVYPYIYAQSLEIIDLPVFNKLLEDHNFDSFLILWTVLLYVHRDVHHNVNDESKFSVNFVHYPCAVSMVG